MNRSLLAGMLWLAALGCDESTEPVPQDALTSGWSMRLDEPSETSAAMRFLQLEDGLEAKAGPNASLWQDDLRTSGDYRITLDVTHLDSGSHPHGAGLTIGGTDVDGADQRYTYFLVRCDQKFLIKNRRGEQTEDIVSWTKNEALTPEDDRGVTRNTLSIEVRGDEARFLVNGTEVHRAAREQLSTDGQIGLRLVHDIHVKFGRPVVERLDEG